jgi:hypothetical protein
VLLVRRAYSNPLELRGACQVVMNLPVHVNIPLIGNLENGMVRCCFSMRIDGTERLRAFGTTAGPASVTAKTKRKAN